MSDGIRSGVNWMRWNCSVVSAAERAQELGQAARHERLGRAGHALDQHVAADQQGGQQQAEWLVEIDQDAARARQGRGPKLASSTRVTEADGRAARPRGNERASRLGLRRGDGGDQV